MSVVNPEIIICWTHNRKGKNLLEIKVVKLKLERSLTSLLPLPASPLPLLPPPPVPRSVSP